MITGLPVNNSALVFLKVDVAGISKEPHSLGMRFSPNFMWLSCGYALTIYPKITLISTVAILMDQRDA